MGQVWAAPAPTHTLSFRIQDEPETLDWNRAHTLVEANLLMNLMEGLVSFNASSEIEPALAKKWTKSADGKTYRFELRPGVKWSDGVALRAQDFVYSWKRLLSPLTAASYAYSLFDIEGAEAFSKGELLDFEKVGIKALDDLTLEVKLARPVSYWINLTAFWVTFPMRKDIVDKYGSAWETPGRMVNLGPFSLVSHDVGSKIIMKANPTYYRAKESKGNVDQLIAMILKDDASALAAYQAGQIDILTELTSAEQKQFKGKADLRSFPLLKTAYLGLLTEKYPISNLKLRRAIAMAIDKKKLTDLLKGGEKPATSFIPAGMSGYSKNLGLPFDVVRAKKEMQGTGIDPTTLTLGYVLPDWEKSKTVAHFIQSELKKNLGINLDFQTLENQQYRAQLDLHTYPLFDYSWTADYPDPDNFLSVFLSTSGNSRTTWKNSSFDKAVLEARYENRPKARENAYLQLQKQLLEEETVIVPLYYEPNLALVHSRVKEFELNSLGYLYLRKVNVVP